MKKLRSKCQPSVLQSKVNDAREKAREAILQHLESEGIRTVAKELPVLD